MQLLVLGTSSSGGTGLADPALAWPQLVARELARGSGQETHVEHVIVFPVGERAVPLAMKAVDRVAPDLVIYSYGAYPCAVATVGARVRRRYGLRVHGLFRRIELGFERWTANRDGPSGRLNRWGRWLARRVIGAEPMTSYEQVFAIETGLLSALAQREGLEVIVFGEPSMGSAIARDNPAANSMLARLRTDISAAARAHHFQVADCTTAFDSYSGRDLLFHSDGVHKTVLGHEVQAGAILALLSSS